MTTTQHGGKHRIHGRHRAPTRLQRLLAKRHPWSLPQHFAMTAAYGATLLIGTGILGGLL